jgi:autotransporter-associated beta strand protein
MGLLATSAAHGASTAWQGGAADINWSTGTNWTNNVPTATNDIFFIETGATGSPGTPNNTVDSNTSIKTLSLINQSTTTYHTTLINPGVTLTLTNTASANILLAGNNTDTGTKKLAHYIQGPGASLVINAPNSYVAIREWAANGGTQYTLDMSGLDNFSAVVNRIRVGGESFNRPAGTLLLAQTNTIYLTDTGSSSAFGFLIGFTAGSGGDGGTVALGMTNGIFCDGGMGVGLWRCQNSRLYFNPSTAIGGTAYFRNYAGTGRQNYWWIGDGSYSSYSGNMAKGIVDFSNGSIDAMVNQLVVGRNQTTAGTTAVGAQGYLTLTAGTLDVNTAIICYQMVDNNPQCIGQVNVNGTAQLIVNNSMQLGHFMAALPANGVSQAVLNIGTSGGGGSVTVKAGGITTVTNAGSASDSEIHVVYGGSLSVAGLVGPLSTFELTQGNLTLDFGYAPIPSSPACTTSNLLTTAPATLSVLGSGLYIGQFALIKYQTLFGGGADDFSTLNLPANVQGYLSNNLANSSIDLVITNLQLAVWNGNINGNWDINTSANWRDLSGNPVTYQQSVVPGNFVTFDDSATGTTTVNLTAASLAPDSILVSNSFKNYTLTGSGALTGPSGLNKSGSGTLTIANSGSNSFSGAISINGGTLQLGGSANRLPTGATVTLANGAGTALDLNNQNQMLGTLNGGGASGGNVTLGSGTLTVANGGAYAGVISGAGTLIASNSGTLTLSGANLYSGGTLIQSNATLCVTNATGSGLGSGNINVAGGFLYIGSTAGGAGGPFGDVAAAAITNNLSDPLNLASSIVYVNRSDDYTFNPVLYGSGQMSLGYGLGRVRLNHANFHSGLSVATYGPVRISDPNALGTGPMLISDNAAALELVNGITVTNTLQLYNKGGAFYAQYPNILNVSGTNTLTGQIQFIRYSTDWVIRSDAGKLLITGPLTNIYPSYCNYWLRGNGDGEVVNGIPMGAPGSGLQPTNALTKDGLGTWTLWGNNTYNAYTTISNGTLYVNGSITPGNTLPISLVRVYGGTLSGTGRIDTAVSVYSGGIFAPGTSATGLGTLTLNNSLTLMAGSTNLFKLSAAGTVANDKIVGISTVTYGGTLKATLNGSLKGGEVFKLYSATAYGTSTFNAFDLPTLPAALSWDTSQLVVDGTLRVVGGNIQVGQVSLAADGNFQLSGTSASTNQAYRVLATTNVADPLSWTEVGSGAFTGGGFSFVDLNSTNYPHRFYRVVMP